MKKILILSLMILMIPESKASDFTVKSNLSYLQDVAVVANCVTTHPDFLKEVAAHKQFDFTAHSSFLVSQNIARLTPVILSTYKKSFTKSIAYRNIGSNVLYFNTTKNPRSMRSMVNTACHERSHVVGYGHGDNSAKGKENSVPYSLGSLCEKYADKCNSTKTK